MGTTWTSGCKCFQKALVGLKGRYHMLWEGRYSPGPAVSMGTGRVKQRVLASCLFADSWRWALRCSFMPLFWCPPSSVMGAKEQVLQRERFMTAVSLKSQLREEVIESMVFWHGNHTSSPGLFWRKTNKTQVLWLLSFAGTKAVLPLKLLGLPFPLCSVSEQPPGFLWLLLSVKIARRLPQLVVCFLYAWLLNWGAIG